MAGRTLQGGRKAAGEASGAGGEVQDPQEVPAATHHLGRRAENALFQGKDNLLRRHNFGFLIQTRAAVSKKHTVAR